RRHAYRYHPPEPGRNFGPDPLTPTLRHLATVVRAQENSSDPVIAAEAPAMAVCFSPDGRTLAEAVGPSIRLWDLNSRRVVRRIKCEADVSALEFSPDGRRLAAGAAERLQLWDVAGGKLLADWRAHRTQILVVAFSPSGLLASASRDGLVRLWNGTTGEEVATFSGHFLPVETLSFSPDGRLLASAGSGDSVKLWSLVTYEEVATLHGLASVRGLSFSPTHLILAVTGVTPADGRGHLRLWCAGGPDATWQPLIAPQLERPAAR
ncbi:MAG TPA: WD40 repeat domain-containing protein, partial [Pirellulales bacterium]|nr:WD40 repeat domain-containing protein [Pirellulales bacterium]